MPNPKRLKCRVEDVRYHSESVSSVYLKPLSSIPKFKAGQFLHFTLEDFDPSIGFWPESRVFSIASSPSDSKIRIVYSVKGYYTKRMFSEIKKGNEHWVKLPYGHFVVGEDEPEVILVAGGTGITPFVPFLLEEADKKSDRKITLFYGFRETSLCIFEVEILKAYKSCKNFKPVITCEEKEYKIEGEIDVKRGVIDRDLVLEEARKSDSVIYLSGPQNMIIEFKRYFATNDIAEERIKTDEWE